MLVLVDYQVIPTDRATIYIFGLYNTDDGALYYYKRKEFESFIRKELKANKRFKIQGIKRIEDFVNGQQTSIQIERLDGIDFLEGHNEYRSSTNINYVEGSNVIKYGMSVENETVYTKPMKIARFTGSMMFWYQGLRFQYKDADKNKRAAGFNLDCSVGWKETKNYFYVNRLLTPLTPQLQRFIQTTWPPYMTQDYFTKVLNNFQQYYILTAFYRTNLPFCKELDFSNINTKNITSLRNCFWHNKTIERVSFKGLNLDGITDFYWPFHLDEHLKFVDFRGCKGDLHITDRVLTNIEGIAEKGGVTCFLLNEKQIKFAALLRSPGYAKELVDVKSVKDLQAKIDFVIASSKLMTDSIPNRFFVRMK